MPLVVPMHAPAKARKGQPAAPPQPLDPTFALIAAAQMHGEGRLVKPGEPPTPAPQNQLNG